MTWSRRTRLFLFERSLMPKMGCEWMTGFFQVLNIQQLPQSWGGGGSNFWDTHFLKAFSKDLFHSHLRRLQLAKCENLTCKWQWSWATAEVIPLIHWHFWDSETKNVWTFRRRTFGLYTNSFPCSAYAIVIVYSDSQPSSLECQADTRDGDAHKQCPFPCS